VLGTFLASGLFHEYTILARAGEWVSRVPLFFLLQGGSVIGERIWKKMTGRRADGFLSQLWVSFDIIILGQSLFDVYVALSPSFIRSSTGEEHTGKSPTVSPAILFQLEMDKKQMF
jgi:hypothetical protein